MCVERGECNMRIGIGYDVHKLVEDRKLILGGVLHQVLIFYLQQAYEHHSQFLFSYYIHLAQRTFCFSIPHFSINVSIE